MPNCSAKINSRIPNILNSVRFYRTRLRRASLTELVYRLGQAGNHYRAGWFVKRGQIPCRIPHLLRSNITSLSLPEISGQVTRDEVERILAGFRFTLNADPEELIRFEREQRQYHCSSTRSFKGKADIRAVWEPGRLQHVTILLTWLRQQPDACDNVRIKEFARAELLDWLADNPFLYGPHYLSAMECALRLPVFFYGLKTLDNLNNNDVEIILKGIFLHAWWIEKNLSLYSSLGNHTVCEAMGLVFAGAIFRETDSGRQWLGKGMDLLGRELSHQVLADGGPAEQAFGYHRFVLDIYRLAASFLEANGLRRCSDIKERLLLGEAFLASFNDRGTPVPTVGDYDDGHAVAPGLFPRRPVVVEQKFKTRTFSQSGYTVIRGANAGQLTLDHGPLGLAPLYNHGHADALSITLSVAGVPFLVDCGTYRYNGDPVFRRYFKSTRAHNTVTVSGLDQAEQLTEFVWGEPFTGTLEGRQEQGDQLCIQACHTGYERLAGQVRHARSISWSGAGLIEISDCFSGCELQTFELNFHFHPGVTMARDGRGWLAQRAGQNVHFELLKGEFELHRGEVNPPLGWFSPEYGLKAPTHVLQARVHDFPVNALFETRIRLL
jgi:hypothetical protein